MRVYLSARYDRLGELALYRDDLVSCGIVCTSRWLDGSTLEQTTEHALVDLEDVRAADVLVAWSEEPVEFSRESFAARGGRHVEFGVALERRIPIIVVGPQENVFHWAPGVAHVASWAEALATLHELAIDEIGNRIVRAALCSQS